MMARFPTIKKDAYIFKAITCCMYILSFTGGNNAGGGRINTRPPEAAMLEVEEKTNLLVNRLED